MNFLKYHEEQYNKKGFTVVKNMFSKKEISNLINELEDIKIKVEKKKKFTIFSQNFGW